MFVNSKIYVIFGSCGKFVLLVFLSGVLVLCVFGEWFCEILCCYDNVLEMMNLFVWLFRIGLFYLFGGNGIVVI